MPAARSSNLRRAALTDLGGYRLTTSVLRGGVYRIGAPDTFRRGWHRVGCQPCAVRHYSAAPPRVGHRAQVALLHCPIPRDGILIISKCVGGQKAINSNRSDGTRARS
jgi:hypothetical protein